MAREVDDGSWPTPKRSSLRSVAEAQADQAFAAADPAGQLRAAIDQLAGLHEQMASGLAELAELLPAMLEEREARACFPVPQPEERPAAPAAPEPLLSSNDLATLLSATTKSVRRWRSEGQLPPALEIGGVLRWRRSTVEAWLAEREGKRG